MNKTTNKTKSLNTKYKPKSKTQPQSEEDAIIKAVCTLVALLLGFFIANLLVSAVPGLWFWVLIFFLLGGSCLL
nr:MAG TPA: hypothetical protein [Caudoviricetes sp.]